MLCDRLKLFFFNYFHNDQRRGKHMVFSLSFAIAYNFLPLRVFNFYRLAVQRYSHCSVYCNCILINLFYSICDNRWKMFQKEIILKILHLLKGSKTTICQDYVFNEQIAACACITTS